ncbi:PIN domain-containing protein [Nonomuraea polychroma]|uniref:PIN domain-containing protein n=1 Tax=Nonomuraea polychroma TaxID=46176 RepID=UPI001F4E02A6|nr:PIN domain-containing protein [Nonomuraea polychroma]
MSFLLLRLPRSAGSSSLESVQTQVRFLSSIVDGELALEPLVLDDAARMAELVRTYSNFPLGAADASVIAVAERLDAREVATLDHRHFHAIKPKHVTALTLLP